MLYLFALLAVLGFAADALLLRVKPFCLGGREWQKYLLFAGVVNLWAFGALLASDVNTPLKVSYFLLVNGLFLMTVTDLREQQVYDLHFIILLLVGLISAFFQAKTPFWLMYLTFFIIFGVLFIISKINSSLGQGDSRMIACMSLFFPFSSWLEIMLVSLGVAMIYGLIGVAAKKKTMQTEFPFMPFLLIGVLLELTI
jgi:prepilin signal peptidase PulO-like enzyme (type II secretory pathway)